MPSKAFIYCVYLSPFFFFLAIICKLITLCWLLHIYTYHSLSCLFVLLYCFLNHPKQFSSVYTFGQSLFDFEVLRKLHVSPNQSYHISYLELFNFDIVWFCTGYSTKIIFPTIPLPRILPNTDFIFLFLFQAHQQEFLILVH